MNITNIKNKENRIFKIYCLKDPNTLKIKYIGVTVSNLKQRLSQHIYDSKNRKGTYKRNWIKSLLKQDKKPIICLLEYANYKNWMYKERTWIKRISNLTNTKSGGLGIILNRKESNLKSAIGHYKAIIAIDQDKKLFYFKSLKEATLKLDIPQTNISEVLSKRSKAAYGYHFIYQKDYQKGYENNIQIPKKKSKFLFKYNGNNYTPKELANKLQCSYTLITLIANGHRNWKNSKYFNTSDTLEIIKI